MSKSNQINMEQLKKQEEELITSIEYFRNSLEEGETPTNRIKPVKSIMWGKKLKLFITRYTIGIDLETLNRDFHNLLEDSITEWDGGSLREMLQVSSLCILFNINNESVEKINAIINNQLDIFTKGFRSKTPFQYWLVDYLLQAAQGKECKKYSGDTIKNKVPFYTEICESISNGGDMELAISNYLNAWYKTPRSKHLIDMFDKNDPICWCFEAGALAAMFEIDPQKFEKLPGFPLRLVEHYNNCLKLSFGKSIRKR